MRIAIIKFGALGDVVRGTCLLQPLKRKYPNAEIVWFTLPSAAPLLERNPDIDKIFFRAESNTAFDQVLSLDEEDAACRLASSLSTPKLFGAYADKQGRLVYTPDAKPWFDMGLLNRDTDGSLATANRLKAANQKTYPELLFDMLKLPHTPDEARPVVIPDKKEEDYTQKWLRQAGVQENRLLIGLNTSSGARWKAKQMTLETTVRLIRILHLRFPKAALVLLGGPEEKERHRLLLQKSEAPLLDSGTNNSLPRFLSLINRCHALVSSDSLAMHLGVALRKPVVAFFGPTSSAEIELGPQGVHWIPSQPCACFYRPSCTQKTFCLDTLDLNQAADYLRKVV